MKALGDKLGVRQSTISTWEKQQYPSLQAIEKVCKFYDVDLSHFFAEDSDRKEVLPSYIKQEQAEILKVVNTQFDAETRVAFWELFHTALKSFASASGVKID